MSNVKRVMVNILSKDRPTELYGLLLGLYYQSYKNYDIFIIDDGSGTPVMAYHFMNCIINRLKYSGHHVEVLRNNQSEGILKGRQKLAEYCIKHGEGSHICRLDDDIILEPDYLSKLVEVCEIGFDLASGVTTPCINPVTERETRFVVPVINRVVLDSEGRFVINCDDCGHTFDEEIVLPTDHFRSCALYDKKVHEFVNYEDDLTNCGFREEEFFSFRMIMKGFKLGVNTQAINWHLITPSGGDRQNTYGERALQNQKILNRKTQKWFKKHGDFIEEYHKRLGLTELENAKFKSLNKNTNLVYSREV